MSEHTYSRFLAALFTAGLAVSLIGIGWGLPNGDRTWAADSVGPMTPLSVAYHVFLENGFNSGYFYFKYPIGHQLVLASMQAPLVAFAYARGDLDAIAPSYPYGFRSPEAYLTALSLIARVTSALAAAALLLLVAGIARRLGDPAGDPAVGIFAAWSALANYPLVFYAHTSNVEVPYLLWAFLALYSTIRAVDESRPGWYLVLGVATAMAVSTKEQVAGFLVLLPALIAILHWTRAKRADDRALIPRGAAAGALAAALTCFVVNAGFFNPAGVLHRLQFLTHTLDPALRVRFAPYELPIDFVRHWTVGDELDHAAQTAAAVVTSIGWPAAIAALAGLAVMAATLPSRLPYVVAPLVGYYVFSLRILALVEIRYVMPIAILASVPAAFFLASLWQRGVAARATACLIIGFGLLWSGEVLPMLVDDARYDAERWMAPQLAQGKSVEVYQSWTYLPRWCGLPGVYAPAFDQITIENVLGRSPDYIVLSSKAKEGITMYPNPDWQDGRGRMFEREANRNLLEALENGRLGYEKVAVFERPVLFRRELITSLDPAISVYARRRGEPKPGGT